MEGVPEFPRWFQWRKEVAQGPAGAGVEAWVKGRGLLQDKEAGRARCKAHPATCRASGAENAGSGVCALGSWRSRRAVPRPEKASGIWGRSGEELRADRRTRQELGKQRGGERGEPRRASALLGTAGLTGNAPDQVPDQ